MLQTGIEAVNLGEIDINLDTKRVSAKLISVDSRLDGALARRSNQSWPHITAPKSISMRSQVIGNSPFEFERKSTEMLNLLSDFSQDPAGKSAESLSTWPS